MSSLTIPDLKRKLDLLIAFGPRKTWAELAVPFGRAPKTLRWWADGDGSRAPGTIPHEHVETLQILLREALPESDSTTDVRQLLFDDFRTFSQALRAQNIKAHSLAALID